MMGKFKAPWPATLLIACTALAVNGACLWIAAHASSISAAILAAMIFSFSNHTIFVVVHEAVHGISMPSRFANEVFGSILAATFPQSFCLQRAFHLSHHRNNRTDSEFFDAIRDDDIAWLKICQWYGILLGEYWLRVPLACLLWLVCPALLRKPFLRDTQRSTVRSWGGYNILEGLDRVPPIRSRIEILWAIAFHALCWYALDLNLTAVLLCYAAFAVNWGSLQYATHAFSERSVRDGAFDLRAPGWLRVVLLNYHLHLVHHRDPTIPWSQLPRFVDDLRPRPSFLGQYLKMWLGPRRAWGESPQPERALPSDPDMLTA